MKRTILLLIAAVLTTMGYTQINFPVGKKAAIILTYDDGLMGTKDIVESQLDKYNFKATFFLIGTNIKNEDIPAWRAMAKRGHELGNHTLFHNHWTGNGETHGIYRSLEDYTVDEMVEECRMMNNFLTSIDNKPIHPMAYSWGHYYVGKDKENYSQALINSGFINYCRYSEGENPITDLNKLNCGIIPAFPWREKYQTADSMIVYIQHVLNVSGIGVIIFHGVGTDYLKISAEEHQRIIDYLGQHREIWVAPMSEVFDYVYKK